MLRIPSGVPTSEMPSGSRPRSAGARLSNRLSGDRMATSSTPRDKQAVRHPELAIRVCSQGRIVIEPTPTPENAILNAQPAPPHKPIGQIERLSGVGEKVHAAADKCAKGQVKLPRLRGSGSPE